MSSIFGVADQALDGQFGFIGQLEAVRNSERMDDWDDKAEKLGEWQDAYTTATPNPSGRMV